MAPVIPPLVRVLGKRYRLEPIADPDIAVARGGPYSCLGATDFHRGLIRYRAGAEVSPDEVADTVLHEVLHLIVLASDGEARASGKRGESLVEALIASVTPVLLDVLRQNPELIGYLCKEAPLAEEEAEEKAP